MIGTKHKTNVDAERKALWRRIRRMYDWLNSALPDKCYSLVDPKLTEGGKVDLSTYREGMIAFKAAYGSIHFFHVRISLHLDASSNKHDSRPFAYVYITWQDETHGFHMFRERWVKHAGKWYTRVAGLVANKNKAG